MRYLAFRYNSSFDPFIETLNNLADEYGCSKARMPPVSAKKGGISHCDGNRFICNDGSISQSKKDCLSGGFKGNTLSDGQSMKSKRDHRVTRPK